MALITCPECGKEVSDKAKQCIHCGFPFETNNANICNINGIKHDLSFVIDSNNNIVDCSVKLAEMTGCHFVDVMEFAILIRKNNQVPNVYNIRSKQEYLAQQSNVPKCPTCGSTNIRKISVGAKMGGAAMFGLFSKTAKSQFECGNCKYKW